MIKIGIKVQGALVALAMSGATYAEVSVPHTFTAGTPAKAIEVNENFTALAGAMNGVVQLKLHDESGLLGVLLSTDGGNGDYGVISSKGYVAIIDTDMNKIGGGTGVSYFVTNNCTGDGYVNNPSGVVFSNNDDDVFYVEATAGAAEITYNSSGWPSSCSVGTGVKRLYLAKENDEIITGIRGSVNGLVSIKP